MTQDDTDRGMGGLILPFTASPAKAARLTAPGFRMGAVLHPVAGAGLAQARQMLDCAGMAFANIPVPSHPVITSAACPNFGPTPGLNPNLNPGLNAGPNLDQNLGLAAPIMTSVTSAGRPSGQRVTQRGTAGPLDAGHGPATDRDPLSRRIVSIHLTDFAIARWLRWAAARHDAPPDDLPVVLAAEGAHGPVVTATNRAATLAGLHIGARVVDIRALCPQVRVVRADPDGDRAALDKLMLWARRWCPWTAVDGADGIVMDTTGSDHLWGGEAAMLRDIEGTLGVLGFAARLALAPTHGAAWALARYGAVRAIATPQTFHSQTAPLPARALRLDGDTVLLLQRLGLKSIGDLAAVPRASLARRFATAPLAQNPLLRLDQLQGRQPEPVNARTDPPRFAVQARLPEPVQDPTPYLAELCEALCETLAKAGHGARKITVTVYRTDGEVSHVTAATARASRDPNHLRRLFDDRLERIDPGFGFELITLAADTADPLQAVQGGLDGRTEDGAALAQLVDRLSAKLGAGAVRTPSPRASHIPERSLTWMSALSQAPGRRRKPGHTNRPLRLLDTPEEIHVLYAIPEGPPVQFRWRRVSHRIAQFHGPERIAPEWWTDRATARLRDYYRIEDDTRRRLWIYRDGIYSEIYHLPPQWFMHGVFA